MPATTTPPPPTTPVPAPAAPPASPPEPPKPTTVSAPPADKRPEDFSPEEIEALQQGWVDKAFGRARRVKPARTPEQSTPAPVAPVASVVQDSLITEPPKPEPAAIAPAPAPKPEPKPRKVAPVEVPPPPAPVVQQPAPTPPTPAPAPAIDLDDADKETLRTLEVMETLYPESKGIKQKTLAFWQREAAYIEKWQEANPGQEFNEEEHADFYTAEPRFDQRKYRLAEKELWKKEAAEESDKKIKVEQAKQNDHRRMVEVIPTVRRQIDDSIKWFIKEASPELAKLMLVDGKEVLSEAIEKQMAEEDPATLDILLEEGEPLGQVLQELRLAAALDGSYILETGKTTKLQHTQRTFQPARELRDFVAQIENEMLKLPPEATARDGRRLISSGQWMRHVDAIENSGHTKAEKNDMIEAFNAKYYVLEADDYARGLQSHYAERAQKRIAKLKKVRNVQSNGSSTLPVKPAESGVTPEVHEEPPTPPRVKAPSTSSASDSVNTQSPSNSVSAISVDDALAVAQGRR